MSVNDTVAAQADFDSLFLPDDFSPTAESTAVISQTPPSAELAADVLSLNAGAVLASESFDSLSDPTGATSTVPSISHVPASFTWNDIAAQIDGLMRGMALASGRLESLTEREAMRVLEVAEAKGRAEFRPEVEDVLEKLQKEAHERSVGQLERRLTAIAQDVQPVSSITIKLSLSIKLNMPALDIYGEVQRPKKNGENPEDYIKREDLTSGALANVVSTGLRFIALARSLNRRFLLLDEADCWIETKDVQNFFNVVNQLSREAGIQTVIITHHDLSAFEDDFRIYRINEIQSDDQWKMRLPELVSPGQMTPSELQHDVLSFVHAQNFEAYKSAHIDLAPGVTAITGINRGAKSAWSRMLRAAFLGESSDNNIRHGQSAFKVAVGFSDGRVLECNRRLKGSPKGDFIMHTQESWEFARENQKWQKDPAAPRPLHNSPVATLPDWVPDETGVGLIDKINVQLWGQLTPVFMLNESANKRASLLSIGRESGYLYAMSELNKEDINNDNKLIRDGEKEIFSLRGSMLPYQDFASLRTSVDVLGVMLQELIAEDRWLARGSELLANIEQNRVEGAYLQRWRGLEELLPRDPFLTPTQELVALLEQLDEAKTMQAAHTDIRAPSLPEVLATTALAELVKGLAVAKADSGLKGRVPELPEIPAIVSTAQLQELVDFLCVANTDKCRPIVEMPAAITIKKTQPIEQWLAQVNQANIDRTMPRMKPLAFPTVLDTTQLDGILNDTLRIGSFLKGCKGQSAVLSEQFSGVQKILEKASKTLGFTGFELPVDVAQALAEGAVISYQSDGARDKVVAYFEKITEQIQVAARKGYLQAVESNLDLPPGFLDHAHPKEEPDPANAMRSKRP